MAFLVLVFVVLVSFHQAKKYTLISALLSNKNAVIKGNFHTYFSNNFPLLNFSLGLFHVHTDLVQNKSSVNIQ